MTDESEHTPPPPPPYQPPQPPPAPPADPTYAPGAAPKKKGLPPLAWVGIGCGVLLLLGALVFAVLVGWGVKKAGDLAHDMEDPNTASMTIAKTIVRVNPELELVDSDDDDGTLTIRNKKTGEVLTVDVSEVEEGRFSFKGEDGEEVTMGMEKGEDGQGAFTVRDREGNETFRVGAGGEENIPRWVPRYEGVEISGTMANRSGGETNGGFAFETDDSVEDVLAFYADELEDEGMTESGRSDNSAGDSRFINVGYQGDGRTINTLVTTDGKGKTHVVVSYTEKNE
jgi:hypothetical protein